MIEKQKFKSSRRGKIISVGPLEINSGFDLLIQSWVNVNEKLEIIGKGSQESSLNELVKSYGLDKKIKIEKDVSVKKINERFQIAKCLIIPYLKEENLDLIRQALNYEIPIIGTDLNKISKIIPREFLAKPKDLNSLQSVIEEMIPMLSQFDLLAIKRAVIENY
ncbi:MAG: glycosyltransferase [Gammaproteobacteria bacterium]